MKNYFSNIIEKAKNFVTDLTPAAKIKYIVITVLTVTIAASLLVAVSLNTSEPETPTNPEDFETGGTATIDFDNEMIFDVSDSTSGSTAIEGTESSSGTSDESSNITTDDDTSSKETPDEPDESTSEDEPQPTDPSQTNNDDPEPVITTHVQITNDPQTDPKPTETTTKKPQTEPKPTEATTKTPQTDPKPTETTKTPQTEPKPTDTTTKTPQTEPKPTETQPQEDPPQQSGQFSVKEKKYDYNGANVSILQVENKSEQAYTITITGKFKDANGKVIKTESKTFEGFPAGWSNYFVFQPSIKYNSVSWDISAAVFTGNVVADFFEVGGSAYCTEKRVSVDANGNMVYILTPELIKTLKEVVAVEINYGPLQNKYGFALSIMVDTVLFDSNGKIIHIGNSAKTDFTNKDYDSYFTVFYNITDILWTDKDKFAMPDNLKNSNGIVALTSVTE